LPRMVQPMQRLRCQNAERHQAAASPHQKTTALKMADFGEILQSTGEFGLFQKITLLALCLPNVIQPFHFASVFFIQSDPERHCNTDWILQADSNLTTDEQLNLTLPREEDGTFSRCQMFLPVEWDIGAIREYGLNETTGCRDGWVYYDTLYEFDLVCEQANLLEVAQAVLMAGILFGCLLFGPFIPVIVMLIFSLTTGLCPNFYLYLFFIYIFFYFSNNCLQHLVCSGAPSFLTGGDVSIMNSNVTVPDVLFPATEWIGPSKRSWGACVAQLFGAGGNAVLAGVIYFIRDWRLAQLLMSVTVLISGRFIPESARWLLDKGRTEEAKQLIVKAAAINKRTVPDSLLEKVFSLNLTYYCLSFNVGNLGLDIFLTQLMFGLTEVPAHILCIWLLEVMGRKVSLMATLLIGGFLCVLILAVPQGNKFFWLPVSAPLGSTLFSELTSCARLSAVRLCSRQTASGLCSIASRAGGLLSPLLNILALYHWSIPIIVYSSLTLTSGALSFLLPETRRKELPDSTHEAEGNR
uniref:Solute carrier family 22 member 13a n=1 Tax=Cyclopterus lumpus TaxID=8103 RepID=A0A8C2ZM45_CYCLU